MSVPGSYGLSETWRQTKYSIRLSYYLLHNIWYMPDVNSGWRYWPLAYNISEKNNNSDLLLGYGDSFSVHLLPKNIAVFVSCLAAALSPDHRRDDLRVWWIFTQRFRNLLDEEVNCFGSACCGKPRVTPPLYWTKTSFHLSHIKSVILCLPNRHLKRWDNISGFTNG